MLPDGWKEAELKELGTFSKGKGIAKSEVVQSGLPCIRYGEIYTSHHYLVREFLSFITSKTAAESRRLKTNDLLFAGSGETREEIGKCVAYTQKDEVYAGGDIVLFSPSSREISSGFLSYYLNTAGRRQINRLGTGHSVVHVYAKDLENVKVIYPSFEEQQIVLEILSEWDTAARKLIRQIAEKQKQKKALMQRLLTGKHRFPEFKGQEWQEVELGDIFKEVKTKVGEKDVMPHSITAGTGFVSHAEKWGKDISGKQYENYTLLKKGQFAYNKGNSKKYACGCMYLLRHENEIAVPNVFISFECRKDNICNKFYEQYFIADYCARELKRYITSGARSDGLLNLSKKDFFTVKVPLPPKAEQQKIATVLNAADKEINLLAQKLEAYQDQKKGLMQQLLTGKKRVNLTRKEAA